MKKVAIYGAGNFGDYIFDEIHDKATVEVVCFIDNHKRRDSFSNLDKPIIVNRDMFLELYSDIVDTVIVASICIEIVQEMVMSLHHIFKGEILIADKNVYSGMLEVMKGNEFYDYIRDYHKVKPILSYVEFDVTNFCNLKCKNCGHMSDQAEKMEVADIAQFKNSVKKMSELFSNVSRFRLMGGEPFLVKQIGDYAKCVREYFPSSGLIVVTNGLLIDEISDDLIKELGRLNVVVEVSQYPPTRKIAEKIITRFEDNGVMVVIGRLISSFMKREEYDFHVGSYSSDVVFNNCPDRSCHTLRDGKLMICGTVLKMLKSNSVMAVEESKHYTIDLNKGGYDGWDSLMLLEKPIPLCSMCHNSLIRSYEPWGTSTT